MLTCRLDNLNRYLRGINMPYSKMRKMREYFLHCKDMFQSKWHQQMLYHLSFGSFDKTKANSVTKQPRARKDDARRREEEAQQFVK